MRMIEDTQALGRETRDLISDFFFLFSHLLVL
jgi:hypothetical protein